MVRVPMQDSTPRIDSPVCGPWSDRLRQIQARTVLVLLVMLPSQACSLLNGINEVSHEGAPCTTDADCDDSQFTCATGRCVSRPDNTPAPPAACTFDSDCASTEPMCSSGVCLLPRATNNSDAMVEVQGGILEYGGESVTIPTLEIDRAEVSVADYMACVEQGACSRPGDGSVCNFGNTQKLDYPINCVTAGQADDFCEAAGKRLPTEYEHRWLSQQGDRASIYPWGDDEPDSRACWGGRPSDPDPADGPCPIGSFPDGDSRDGLYDLAGNVMEWMRTPVGAAGRVLRGGGWTRVVDDLELLKGAMRSDVSFGTPEPLYFADDVGIRCVKEPVEVIRVAPTCAIAVLDEDRAEVAVAEPQTLTVQRPVFLSAAASAAVAGDRIAAYAWSIVQAPAGATTVITSEDRIEAEIKNSAGTQDGFDLPGSYEIRLATSNDFGLRSAPCSVTVTVVAQ